MEKWHNVTRHQEMRNPNENNRKELVQVVQVN